MECSKCNTSNSETNKFCSQCGTILDPISCALDAYICRQVDDTIKTLVKERDLVELELVETISNKLMDRAKRFSYFVGIPITLLSIMLVFIGIKSSIDIDKATNNVIERSKNAEDVLIKAEKLAPKIKEASENYEILSKRMLRIEDIGIGILFDPKIEKEIKDELLGFVEFLEKVGFNPKRSFFNELKVKIDEEHKENTRYDKKQNIIYLGKDIRKDEDLIFREYVLFVLETSFADVRDIKKESFDDPKESFDDNCTTIESGLADYFTCRKRGNPKLGVNTAKFRQERHGSLRFPEDCLRDLTNKNKFGDLRNADAWQFGGIWGAAFWEMRELWGKDTTKNDKLLFEAWNEFIKVVNTKKYSTEKCFPIFVKIILEMNDKLNNGKYNADIKGIFVKRGIQDL